MKRVMIILGWIMVVSMVAGGLIFVKNYYVAEDHFTTIKGTISSEPKTTQDEYGVNTSLRIHLDNQKGVFSLPGNLLRQVDQDILQLKEGDEISLTIRNEDNKEKMAEALNLANIWGIEKVDGPTYLTLKQAINYHRSFQTLLYAGFCFAIAVGLGVYLTRLN
jgi:hypothetical protein